MMVSIQGLWHLIFCTVQIRSPPHLKKEAFTLQIPVEAEQVKIFPLRINLATHAHPSMKKGSRRKQKFRYLTTSKL